MHQHAAVVVRETSIDPVACGRQVAEYVGLRYVVDYDEILGEERDAAFGFWVGLGDAVVEEGEDVFYLGPVGRWVGWQQGLAGCDETVGSC